MAFVTLNGVTLHYRLAGPANGLKLVFSNSLGTDARIWDEVIAPLSATYRILSYDKRGHGLSDAPAGPYRLDDHVDDLLALADHVGFANFGLAGVSVGGLIAQRLTIREPARVSALVLCDTAAKIGNNQLWNDRIDTVRRSGIAAISDAILDRWFAPGLKTADPAAHNGWRNLLERTPVEGYIGTCASIRDADLTAEVSAITLPTLVIAGEEDRSTPPDLVRATAALVPNARFQTIAGAGHIPSVEAPERLTALMQAYFKEIGYV